MKVRLTSDQKGPNPDFNYKLPRGPKNPVNLIIKAGTEIEHPEAIYLVINGQAEPVDDEAKEACNRHFQRLEKSLMGNRPTIAVPAEPQSTPVAHPEKIVASVTSDESSQPPAWMTETQAALSSLHPNPISNPIPLTSLQDLPSAG